MTKTKNIILAIIITFIVTVALMYLIIDPLLYRGIFEKGAEGIVLACANQMQERTENMTSLCENQMKELSTIIWNDAYEVFKDSCITYFCEHAGCVDIKQTELLCGFILIENVNLEDYKLKYKKE